MNAAPAAAAPQRIRPLAREDLDAVVAIDAVATRRSRREYFERRLAAALREPAFHVQYAVDSGGRLVGYALARRLEGEFGRPAPALRLEAIGVERGVQGHGAGTALVGALEGDAKRHGVRELRTSALWREHEMLRFLEHLGFTLGGNLTIECEVRAGARAVDSDPGVHAPEHLGAGTEVDYSASAANDFEALARDRNDIRSLAAGDLPHLVRIDRKLTGSNREAYMRRKVDEALFDSAIRVSLTARNDEAVVGFVMAKTDFGDFGRTEPVAVIDTIGVDPDFAHHGVGHALLSQLFVNLSALHIEHVETIVAPENFDLLAFLYNVGFRMSQRLGFVKRLG